MTVPVWFASIIAAVVLAQLLAGVAWAVRTDKDRAVERAEWRGQFDALGKEIARMSKLLEEHQPIVLRAEIDAHSKRIDDLHDKYVAHHRLLRHLARRLDKGQVPDVTNPGADLDG